MTIFRYRGKRLAVAISASMLLPIFLLTPWLVRNMVAFHGGALFSTQGGLNALQGVLTPQGRTQPGDTQKLFHAVGWVMSDIETNNPSRLKLPSEDILNKQCLQVVPGIWKRLGWRAAPLLVRKLADFWLSTDQIFGTESFNSYERLFRTAGVVVYWCVLLFAVFGWIQLNKIHPRAARILLGYAAIYTALHLPLVMSTRIRFPLMDPLITALAGGGVLAFVVRYMAHWRGSKLLEHL
jgi:hypothetical protein